MYQQISKILIDLESFMTSFKKYTNYEYLPNEVLWSKKYVHISEILLLNLSFISHIKID